MPTNLPVATRIAELKKIFNGFGIAVPANSLLDQAIHAEFGRGKKSILTQIITDLQPDSNAAVLAECIGHALDQEQDDPYIKAIAAVMRERIPSLLHICDIREHTTQRIELLQQLLIHFENKIRLSSSDGTALHEQRLLRMLSSAREQLKAQQQLHAMSEVIYRAGVVCDVRELQKFGKILQSVTPVLVAINQHGTTKQQIAAQCVRALQLLSQELQSSKLEKAANIIDDVHLLALINLPKISDMATVQHALDALGIAIGTMTIHKLTQAARARGLSEQELIQILYNGKKNSVIAIKDRELLKTTQQNQRLAASCGLISKLGGEIECKPLEQIGIAGMCLICMRQTYYELKTQNVTLAGFSESLGLFLTGVGALSKNQTIAKLGSCILAGVQAYAGIMAIPGGQAVAIPLAICATVGKMILGDRRKPAGPEQISDQQMLQHILQQIVNLHLDMRLQFKAVFALLQNQHNEFLLALDEGFAQLTCYLQLANNQALVRLQAVDNKLNLLQYSISKEFRDLYLEYIQNPLEEIEFYQTYKQVDVQQLQQHKIKLSMWLLYKAKHDKANGKELIANLDAGLELTRFVSLLLRKIVAYDSVLGLLSRYLNVEFNANLAEDLPHVPTWILCVETYIYILQNYTAQLQGADKEPQIIRDIIAIGNQVLSFVDNIAANITLQMDLTEKMHLLYAAAQQEYHALACIADVELLSNITQICAALATQNDMQQIIAYAAPQDQLENFDAGEFDISNFWCTHLKPHVPQECFAAQALGLGTLVANYAVDASVNGFHDVHMQYSAGALPDQQRDVIFRIDVYFKAPTDQKTLLLTGWLCYDLNNAQRRFDEYYQNKFKYGLRHHRYLWISLNGRQNRVVGNGVSETHKLIDYQRLGTIYKQWLQAAVPVHGVSCGPRLLQHKGFLQKTGTMLAAGECVQQHNISVIKLQLFIEMQQKIMQLRLKLLADLRNSRVLQQNICKIDAYIAVTVVMQQMLSCPAIAKEALHPRMQDVFDKVEQDTAINKDFAVDFNALLRCPDIIFLNNVYQTGLFYQKVQLAITKLKLFLGSINPTIRLL